VRIVVYGEGSLDDSGEAPALPPPRAPLRGEHLGAAHVLVQRVLSARIPEDAIRFESPLRLGARGRARGSNLLVRCTLRELLSWPLNPPDLAVVLVDQDDDTTRKATLEGHIAEMSTRTVIGVPTPEFEAWLLADEAAAARVLGWAPPTPPAPESLDRESAKELLRQWISRGTSPRGQREQGIRVALARELDLSRLKRLRSFEVFAKELLRKAP